LRANETGNAVRRLFTTQQALASGITAWALRWGESSGQWRRIMRGVYGEGPARPDPIDLARARVLSAGGVAGGRLAGLLHELDSVTLDEVPRRRRAQRFGDVVEVAGLRCSGGLDTLIELAATLDDQGWEQALESALRKKLLTVADLEVVVPVLGRTRNPGTARIRRILALRPPGAPPTESLLETLMVQLMREVDGLPEFTRQYKVYDCNGRFIARPDLSCPELGLFLELDGQHHKDQPVYDAHRETAVVAATGWLCGRFTWHEVVHLPRTTARRLGALAHQARLRPLGRAS
jgi:very-short-patch-repair endonuclease